MENNGGEWYMSGGCPRMIKIITLHFFDSLVPSLLFLPSYLKPHSS
jgi:hypothetical protein